MCVLNEKRCKTFFYKNKKIEMFLRLNDEQYKYMKLLPKIQSLKQFNNP